MFTVVIVDDEPLLRLAVTSGINWETIGCRVVAVSYTHLDVYKRQLQDCAGSGGLIGNR